MAVNRGTEAYDLSLFEKRPAKIVEFETNKKAQREKQRRNAIQSFLNTAATLCVAAVALMVIGVLIFSRIRLTELDNKIKDMDKRLVVLNSETIRLNDELARKTSTKSVEEYAYNELGMQKIESSQIEYIVSDNTDKAVIVKKEDKNVLEAAGSAIVNFFTGLAYLFE
ncbi:MAG: cell division protein FtsL [Oscillospiraceae bacterium]|nr:cell division protein FtsL [Oscillospiraceae bacterium]MDD4414645.1 cell division protein FtsL [Oscillospiraceae bacterium]